MMDPTARGDMVADLMRAWYERHRESWWDRHRPSADRYGGHADEFMLRFINKVGEAGRVIDANANGVKFVFDLEH